MFRLTKFINVLKGVRERVRNIIRLVKDSSIINGATYFPEYSSKRKSKFRIFIDQFCWILKYGSVNDFYYLYGFDIIGLRNKSEYVDYGVFRERREELQHKVLNPQVAVLRDKFYFSIITEALNIRSPRTIAIIDGEDVYMFDKKEHVPIKSFVSEVDVDSYMKLIDGECANGVYKLQIQDGKILINNRGSDYEELLGIVQQGKFLVQERVIQHESLSMIFPNAANSVRITSLYDKKTGDVKVLPSFLKVGIGDMTVDNWAIGGLIVGIDVSTGRLMEWAYYKPGYGKKVREHPDTGVVFKDFELPYFDETIDLVKKIHLMLKDVHSIGWDITITPNGPCIIEGNDNWEISALQVTGHGMKKEFKELM